MKSILQFFIYTILFQFSFAQQNKAKLPTSYCWDASTDYPIGWHNYGLTFYTTGNIKPNAGKFDNANDSLVINFDTTAKSISYYLKGYSLKPPYIFQVLESPDGLIYTLLASHTMTDTDTSHALTTKYQMFTFNPLSETRVIKFAYLKKITGNIAIDDVVIGKLITEIKDEKIDSPIKIFPNPVADKLFIINSTKIATIDILNIYGQIIQSNKFNPNEQKVLEVSSFASGVYFILVRTLDDMNVQTFIKK